MTAASLIFLPSARDDSREALNWYLDRSPRAAARFLAALDRAVALIREAPQVWPPFESGTRRYILPGFPYSLIYRQVGDVIQVVAVAHHRRRPGYWR
jgi:plasmid stabilization system protein ParE